MATPITPDGRRRKRPQQTQDEQDQRDAVQAEQEASVPRKRGTRLPAPSSAGGGITQTHYRR